ncbi:MAG TPA: 3,4-dihydroxy-2-butanone-4-phosphate synthase [Polyangiaceae bacterium]|nr:3,4-dihydroxy-2-butanone-4-phosphate synthase [Polyangiaceae bacterium]
MSFESVREAIRAIARGELVVVADDDDRENEGDLILAASAATPEKLSFMVRHTSGVICVAASSERLAELELPLMVPRNEDSHQTAFTVSVDYRHGTTTGISSADRSATIRALADTNTSPRDLTRPGHVFPLRAQPNGVLARAGHTEAAVDLAKLAGLPALGALAEVVNEDGSMARRPELVRFAREHGLVYTTIAELVIYRQWLEEAARCISSVAQAAVTQQRSPIGASLAGLSTRESPSPARSAASARLLHEAALSLETP